MNLKYIREEYELSQNDIASILGVTRSTYSVWEAEINIIPLNRLIDFCNHFNISLDYALGLTNEKTYQNIQKEIDYNTHRERLKSIRKTNKYTQDKIAKILNTDNGVISRYENGQTLILTSFLKAYAKEFNISADYIMGRIDEKVKLKELISN
ncbi:MAG: transcriptional regulator [Bacilli bacterium]|jgi:transcriptional regulator with XRE-family HTH domain|nr:transcriptional regulator [Bacilli bacterium]MCX4254439.1 helix-turn-helix transcriptional regulator [Bacilli bacterium]